MVTTAWEIALADPTGAEPAEYAMVEESTTMPSFPTLTDCPFESVIPSSPASSVVLPKSKLGEAALAVNVLEPTVTIACEAGGDPAPWELSAEGSLFEPLNEPELGPVFGSSDALPDDSPGESLSELPDEALSEPSLEPPVEAPLEPSLEPSFEPGSTLEPALDP